MFSTCLAIFSEIVWLQRTKRLPLHQTLKQYRKQEHKPKHIAYEKDGHFHWNATRRYHLRCSAGIHPGEELVLCAGRDSGEALELTRRPLFPPRATE